MDFAKIETQINMLVEKQGVPNLTVGFVEGGSLTWFKSFGYKDIEGKRRADEHTHYAIASTSKAMTVAECLRA